MTDVSTLPNIGPKLAAELHRAKITSAEQLIELGSVESAARITRGRPHTGYNLVCALEGAIRGVRWHTLRKEDLARIRAEYDERRR